MPFCLVCFVLFFVFLSACILLHCIILNCIVLFYFPVKKKKKNVLTISICS